MVNFGTEVLEVVLVAAWAMGASSMAPSTTNTVKLGEIKAGRCILPIRGRKKFSMFGKMTGK